MQNNTVTQQTSFRLKPKHPIQSILQTVLLLDSETRNISFASTASGVRALVR